MRPIFYGSCYPNTRLLCLRLIILIAILFSISTNAAQPFHKQLGGVNGYEDEDQVAMTGLAWMSRPKYSISATSPARFNSHVSTKIEIIRNGNVAGVDKIIWRFTDPDGNVFDEGGPKWTGSCWTLVFHNDCMTAGWWVESSYFVGNKVGTWTVDTYDVSSGVEALVTSESFEVKGRTMQVTNGANLIVYENDNSAEPISLKLIDYDHTSGTPSKQVTFEVMSRPKGKKSGGLNYIFKEGTTGSQLDSVDTVTSFEGIASVFFESGNKYGTYTIKATSFWAPQSPVEFQVTVKKGEDPNKEEDLITELLDSGRNLGKPKQCDALVGNPINVITGNKYQEETDLSSQGFMSLEFVRYYNSNSEVELIMGPKWSYTYSRFIQTVSEEINGVSRSVAKVHRDNGEIVSFYKEGKSWIAVHADIRSSLILKSKKWQYTDEQGVIEDYNSQGKLALITHQDGNVFTLVYLDSGDVSKVISPSGKDLSFHYNDNNTLNRVTGLSTRRYFYDDANNGMLRAASTDDGNPTYYHYEHELFSALLTGITDHSGIRYGTWEYNDKGQATASFHANGVEEERIEYRNDGSRTVTHVDGTTTEYMATGQLGLGLLTSIDGPACGSGAVSQRSYQYDPINNNLLSKTIDELTTVYGNYTDHGQPGYIIEAFGTAQERRTDYVYDSRFPEKITQIIQPSVTSNKKVTKFTYDDYGHLTDQTEEGYKLDGSPIVRTTRYEYNGPLKQLSLVDGPRVDVADITSFTYYPNQNAKTVSTRLYNVVGGDGTVLQRAYLYDTSGKIKSYKSINDLQITNTFYNNDLLKTTTQTTAAGISRTTFFTYTPSKFIEKITTGYGTPEETNIEFTYDPAQRLTKVSNALGDYIEFELDAQSNVTSESVYDSTGLLQQQVSSVFDTYNHLTSQSSVNEIVNSIYNIDGNLLEQTNGNGVKTRYTYDKLKRLTAIANDTDGTDQSTANSQNLINYDVHNNQTQLTDANGNITSYEFDDFGNLLSENSPDKGTSTFTYDAAGNRITAVDAKQQTLNYQYDAYNRLLLIDAAGASDDISYFYDLCSNGIGKLCKIITGNTEVSYTYNDFGEIASQSQTIGTTTTTVSFSYDLQGRIKQTTYPSGSVVSYTYDIAGNIQAVDLTQNGSTQSIVSDATYTFSGLLINLNFANGIALSNTYDLAGRVTSLTNGPLNLKHSFDGAANMLSQSENLYDYDALNRLEFANTSIGQQEFSYDKNSNRISTTENTIQTQYGIAIGSNILSSINTLTVNHDANGNRLNRHGQSLQYTPYNQLSQVTNVAQYKYNGLGQRVQKTLIQSNTTTSFTYDLVGQLLVEMDGSGNITDEHIYLGDMPIAVLKHQTENSELFYVHTDHLNTPRAITNSDKTEIWQWQSDPFGNGLANSDVNLNGITFIYNKRFPGQYYDGESGLHYNYYRDYDPTTGRYIQSDPIGLNGGMNTYGYVGGNPMMYTDPLGLIEYKGNVFVVDGSKGSFGSQYIHLNVSTGCLNGKKFNIKAKGIGISLGKTVPNKLIKSAEYLNSPTAVGSEITLDDGLPFIDVQMFNGSYMMAGATISWGVGVSYGTAQFGQFPPLLGGLDTVAGVDTGSIGYSVGYLKFDSLTESECGCEN